MRAAAWQARPGPAPASGGLARGGVTPTPARPCEGTGEEGAGPAGQADRGHARRGARALRSNALVPAPPGLSPLQSGRSHGKVGAKGRRRARAEAPGTPGPLLSVASVYPVRRKTSVRDLRPTKRSARASGRQWPRSLLGVAVRKGWRPKVLWGGVPLCGRGTGTRGQSRPGTGDRSESPRGGGKVTAAESSRLSSSVIVAGFRAVP